MNDVSRRGFLVDGCRSRKKRFSRSATTGYAMQRTSPIRICRPDWFHLPTVRERTGEQLFAAAVTTASGANHLVRATTPIETRKSVADDAP